MEGAWVLLHASGLSALALMLCSSGKRSVSRLLATMWA